MPISLNARDRRALLAGALLLGPIGLWRFVVAPGAAQLSELRSEVAVERDLLARERGLLAASSGNRQRSENLVGALVTYAPRIFSIKEMPEEYVRRIADESNVVLHQVVRLPENDSSSEGRPTAEASVRPISLRVFGESDLEGVLSLLAALQTEERLLVVEELELSHQRPVEGRAPEILDMRLVITAFTAGSVHEEGQEP